MKKTILIIGSCLLAATSFALNNNGSEDILKKIQEEHNCTSISFSKEIADFFNSDISINGVEKYIQGDFKEAKLLIINSKLSEKNLVDQFLKGGFQTVELDKEDGENLEIVVLRSGKNISEAHLIIEEEEKSIIISFKGDVNVQNKKQMKISLLP